MTDQTAVPADLRPVTVGEEIGMILPNIEVCQRMRIAEHLRTARILDNGVQVRAADGTYRPHIIPFADAGVIVDHGGMWVHAIPADLWCVRRDGRKVSPYTATEFASWTWILKHQGQSVDYALQYGGYSIDLNEAALATASGYMKLRVGDLVIDPDIRPDLDPDTPSIRHTISVYDRELVRPLEVSQRSDGSHIILDGYLRRLLLLRREHHAFPAPCHVHVGLSHNEEQDLAHTYHPQPDNLGDL